MTKTAQETKTEIIDSYDFSEDAMGLSDFLATAFADKNIIRNDEITVCVFDDQSRNAASVRFERETLTDGSTVVNLIISFDRQYG